MVSFKCKKWSILLDNLHFKGRGIGRLVTMTDLKINEEMFPDLTGIKPIAVIRVAPFHIMFPVAEIR